MLLGKVCAFFIRNKVGCLPSPAHGPEVRVSLYFEMVGWFPSTLSLPCCPSRDLVSNLLDLSILAHPLTKYNYCSFQRNITFFDKVSFIS